MKNMLFVQCVDAAMATRPVLLIPVWGFSALGFRSAVAAGTKKGFFAAACSATLRDYGSLLVFSCAVAAVYVMNQLADIEVDKKNGGMPLIANGVVSIRNASFLIMVLSGIAMIPPLFFHQYIMAVAAAAALFLGAIYSFKPFRFSGRPLFDFISNAAGYGIIAFGAGWHAAGRAPLSILFVLSALPYFLLMAAGSISSTLPDYAGDREDQKATTAVVLGIKPAHTLAMFLLIAAGTMGAFIRDFIAVSCAAASLPFYIGFILRPTSFFMEATYKIGGALCMVAAFLAMPAFIPLALIVFLATWLYFRIRHGIAYPSLVPVKKA